MRRALVLAIKVAHTAVFALFLACLVEVLWSGLVGRPRRRTAMALAFIAGEAAVFCGRGRSCPLREAAERLGDPHGQVTDIFLPRPIADTIPYWSTALLAAGLALNARALLRRRQLSGGV